MSAVRHEIPGDDLKTFFEGGFSRHALAQTGIDGAVGEPKAFVIRDDAGVVCAAVVARLFWGQLQYQNVPARCARGRGYGIFDQVGD